MRLSKEKNTKNLPLKQKPLILKIEKIENPLLQNIGL